MRAALLSIPAGESGTFATLAVMRQVTRASLRIPIVRITAVAIVRTAGSSPEASAALIRAWLDEHTTFVRDPNGLELVTTPDRQLRQIAAMGAAPGDCDDVAVLGAALGLAVGLRARFAVVGRAQGFEHVFTALGDPAGRQWWELDITRPAQDIPVALMQRTLSVEV